MGDIRHGGNSTTVGSKNRQLEIVQRTEERVRDAFQILHDMRGKILDEQVVALQNNDMNGIVYSFLEILDFGYYFLQNVVNPTPGEFFPRLLKECLNPGATDIAKITKDAETKRFFRYCYIIWQGACISMISGSEGQTYREFVNGVLDNLGVQSLQESEKKESKVINERICQNFRQYISNVNNKSQNYLNNMQANRTNHSGISEKNVTEEYYSKPIPRYEKTLYEFEFLIRKRNEKKQKEVMSPSDAAWNETNTKMKEIENKLEIVLDERMKLISESLNLTEVNLKYFQRNYKEFICKNMGDMKESELRRYLHEFFIYKYKYIELYGEKEFRGIEKYKAIADLNLDRIEHEGNQIDYYREDFQEIGQLIQYVIEVVGIKGDRENTYESEKREAMRLLVSRLDDLMCKFEKEKVYKRWYDLIDDIKLFREHRKFLKILSRFTSKKSGDEIKTKFLDKLSEKTSYLEDFIEVSILTKKINLWTMDRDNVFESCRDLNREVYENLTRAFFAIFKFLKKCAEFEAEKNDDEEYSVNNYVVQLQRYLKKEGFNIDKIEPEPKYCKLVEDKSHKKIKIEYFKICEETQYTRLYKMLTGQYYKEGTIHVESFVKKYLDSILDRNMNQEQLVKEDYKINLSQKFLSDLKDSQFGIYNSLPYSQEIFSKRKRIRYLMEKYVDITCFAVEAREVSS